MVTTQATKESATIRNAGMVYMLNWNIQAEKARSPNGVKTA